MKINFRQYTYQFTFRVGFFLFCLFFFSLFCVLGVWQLHRYHFKKTLLVTYQQRLLGSPKPFEQLSEASTEQQFQSVRVEGQYRNTLTILIQNKFYQDHLGYEVLTPLQIEGDKKLLLVDRGWIAKPVNHALPQIESFTGKQQIKGYIKLLNEYQFILGPNILDHKSSPLIMQKINIEELSHLTHQLYYPFILRLDSSAAHGFVRDWTISTVMPERHMGYAIQWFLLAIMIFIAYLCFCFERVKSERQ